MTEHRSAWHIGDEAIYDRLDRSLSAQAMADIDRHVQGCPECARRMRDARELFGRLADLHMPPLEADLTPRVIHGLLAARRSVVRWRWVLAGQAAAATLTLAALSVHLEGWLTQALSDPTFLAVRQAGTQFLAESAAWLAPFLDLVPSLPTRLAPIRLPVPHLDGPQSGWAVLAGSALLLGLLGNLLLLRSPGGAAPSVAERGNRPAGDGRSRT